MQYKRNPRNPLLVIIFAIILFSLFLIIINIKLISTKASTVKDQTSSSLPIKIIIPKINVVSNVEYVGLNENKEVDTPINPSNVAWYNHSPRPGEMGNSVIVGHSGWFNKKPVVFDSLNKLNVGDKIYVENDKKEFITFVVVKIRLFNGNESVPEIFNSSDGKAHLNLITCTGKWNPSTQTYAQRLVVFADKI